MSVHSSSTHLTLERDKSPSKLMRILYVVHRIPYPPNKGDKIRSFNQVKFLGERHELHLACLADERADLAYRFELAPYCRTITAVYLNRRAARLRSLCYLPT